MPPLGGRVSVVCEIGLANLGQHDKAARCAPHSAGLAARASHRAGCATHRGGHDRSQRIGMQNLPSKSLPVYPVDRLRTSLPVYRCLLSRRVYRIVYRLPPSTPVYHQPCHGRQCRRSTPLRSGAPTILVHTRLRHFRDKLPTKSAAVDVTLSNIVSRVMIGMILPNRNVQLKPVSHRCNKPQRQS